MEWNYRYASEPRMLKLWEKLEKQGRANPLRELPLLPESDMRIWKAYWSVALHQRDGSLPLADVIGYVNLISFNGEDARDMVDMILKLDLFRRNLILGERNDPDPKAH